MKIKAEQEAQEIIKNVTNNTFSIEFNNAIEKGFQFKTPESDNWTTTSKTWQLITFLLKPSDLLFDPAFYDGTCKSIFESLGYKMINEMRDAFEPATKVWALALGVKVIVCK